MRDSTKGAILGYLTTGSIGGAYDGYMWGNAKDQEKIDSKRSKVKWAIDIVDIVGDIATLFYTKHPIWVTYTLIKMGRSLTDLVDYSNTMRHRPNVSACSYMFLNNHFPNALGAFGNDNILLNYQISYNCMIGSSTGTGGGAFGISMTGGM
ncbi:hypothetical protein [Leptospira noguchii]|uniref:Uncharacterized protein n=1 Tax=Leptospira noguchii TaxID=28182 RepID=M6VZ18_9LEPT|nr:hypothetical protein [Leptospira noguchii]EMO54793.1 hypothetical protein LEP1GSC172_4330 [Leptospira noguchii]